MALRLINCEDVNDPCMDIKLIKAWMITRRLSSTILTRHARTYLSEQLKDIKISLNMDDEQFEKAIRELRSTW